MLVESVAVVVEASVVVPAELVLDDSVAAELVVEIVVSAVLVESVDVNGEVVELLRPVVVSLTVLVEAVVESDAVEVETVEVEGTALEVVDSVDADVELALVVSALKNMEGLLLFIRDTKPHKRDCYKTYNFSNNKLKCKQYQCHRRYVK